MKEMDVFLSECEFTGATRKASKRAQRGLSMSRGGETNAHTHAHLHAFAGLRGAAVHIGRRAPGRAGRKDKRRRAAGAGSQLHSFGAESRRRSRLHATQTAPAMRCDCIAAHATRLCAQVFGQTGLPLAVQAGRRRLPIARAAAAATPGRLALNLALGCEITIR